jgi:transcriptional regulator with XRE-family HTH domain
MHGEKIKELREQKRISQEVMAEKLHITQSAYSKYESNQVQIGVDMLLRVAEVLEISPMDIINNSSKQINFQDESQNHGTVINAVEKFNHQSKELFDTALHAKDQVITSLQEQVKLLKEQLLRTK